MLQHHSVASRVADGIIYIILIGVSLLCLFPLVNVLAISLSSSAAASAGEVTLWPVDFTLNSYRYVAEKTEFWAAFWVTVKRVGLGLLINMLLTIMCAYPLARTKRRFPARTLYMWYFISAGLFSGGLIPIYITVSNTGLMGSIWALVIPGALPIFNMILLMNFFKELPDEIEEAAFMDGASHWVALWKIYLPLSKPALATLSLFVIVGHWNSWFDGLIYINRAENYPLQSYLQTVIVQKDFSMIASLNKLANLSDRTIKAALIFLGCFPVLIVYPFLQKYFMKGLVMGSVKG